MWRAIPFVVLVFWWCLSNFAFSQPAVVSGDAVREKAIAWLKFNNKFGADSEFVRDMTEVIDESLTGSMNVSFFFGSDLMDSGKFLTMHVYGGAVLSFELSRQQAEAMELGSSSVAVTTSRNMGQRLTNPNFEVSDLRLEGGDTVQGNAKFKGRIRCRALGDVDGSYALRIGYRAQQSVGRFQWLDHAPPITGAEIEFEFGPINDQEDALEPYYGPLALMFDIISVDHGNDEFRILIHSNTVGQIVTVK